MPDDYERPASVGHTNDLLFKLQDIDLAVRRIEELELETQAYRRETYRWMMTLRRLTGIAGAILGILLAHAFGWWPR